MYFANPLGLLGLLALPVIVGIHMFHRRFPPLLVGGAWLWGVETRISSAGRRRDRLPITVSLILELLAALLISLALSEPRVSDTGSARHLIIVLDDSASMRGLSREGLTFRDVAVAEIEQRVNDEDRNVRMTLIRTGMFPTLMGTRAMDWNDAQRVLATWDPRAARHDFQPAWDEALQVLGKEGDFLFLTDDMPEPIESLPAQMEVLALGRKLENAAISAARWDFDSQSGLGSIFFRVSNYGEEPMTLAVRGTAEDQTIFEQNVTVGPGDETPFETTVPGGLGRMRIAISSPDDGLATDNDVTLVEPAVRMITIHNSLPADSVEMELTQRALQAITEWQPGPPDEAHLWITPAGETPPSREDFWWLGIGPIDPSEEVRAAARDLAGPYIIEKQNLLMDGIILGGVVWGGVQPFDRAMVPVISSGSTVLMGQLVGTDTLGYLMNIDLARSNLGDSPDWPILLVNLVENRREALPGLRRWNYRLNEEVGLRIDPIETEEAADLQLVEPDGSRRTLIRDRNYFVEVARLDQTGVYSIEEGEQVHGAFAVNFFDPLESQLTSLQPGRHQPTQTWEPTRISLDNPYSWLIVLAILLILASVLYDWYVVRPKRSFAVR
jgi:Ca-activated chloride channel family protein